MKYSTGHKFKVAELYNQPPFVIYVLDLYIIPPFFKRPAIKRPVVNT